MNHQEYPKRLYFEGKPSMRALHAEHEAELRALHEPSPTDEDAPKRRGRPPKAAPESDA